MVQLNQNQKHCWEHVVCFCAPNLSSRSRFCEFANTVSEDVLIGWLLRWVNKPVLLRGRMWGLLIQTTEPTLSATTVQILCLGRLLFYLKRNDRGGAARWLSHVVSLKDSQGFSFHSSVWSERERARERWTDSEIKSDRERERGGENVHYRTVKKGNVWEEGPMLKYILIIKHTHTHKACGLTKQCHTALPGHLLSSHSHTLSARRPPIGKSVPVMMTPINNVVS